MLSTREIVIKTIILRIISSLVTAWLVYALTSSFALSQKIFWIDFIMKMVLYFIFELGWFKFRKLWT
jgi:uncharacterized membrane protein